MANFNKDDWVEITSQPDKKWSMWITKSSFYDNFLGKVGQITEIGEEDVNNHTTIYRVKVMFPYPIKDNGIIFDAGSYYTWFKADHLIKSSKTAADRSLALMQASVELQEWERFKKKTTDNMLKHIFGPEQKEEKLQEDEWDEKTPVIQNIFDFSDPYI